MTAQSKNILGCVQLNASLGGSKCKNITVQEMVRFYGVMLCTSIELHHLGVYEVILNIHCMLEFSRDASCNRTIQ